jgi:hypothetical protein
MYARPLGEWCLVNSVMNGEKVLLVFGFLMTQWYVPHRGLKFLTPAFSFVFC